MIWGLKLSNFKIREANLQNNQNRGSKLQLIKKIFPKNTHNYLLQ
jgi:hypothetical protein